MNKPVVTFFTIAYNDERYISTTIESVLSQTEGNLAYYIRDNGSTDSTYTIIQEYAKKDCRIKVFHNDENGVFEIIEPHHFTRPESQYLTILDADDVIHPDYAKDLVELAETNDADVVVTGSKMFKDGTHFDVISENKPINCVYHEGDLLPLEVIQSAYGQLRPLWGKLYRTDFFYDKFATWFHKYPGKTLHAIDTVVSLSLFNQAKTVVLSSKSLHFYRIKGQSKFMNHRPDFIRVFDLVEIYELGMEMLRKLKMDKSEGIQFIQSIARGHIKDLIDMMLTSEDAEIQHKRGFINGLLKHPRIYEVEQIIGYTGVMHQLKPLMEFIKNWNHLNGVEPKEFTDILCNAKLNPSSILIEKLLMIYLGYSKEHGCALLSNDCYYWDNCLKIPRWYMIFCGLDEHQKNAWIQGESKLIDLIQSHAPIEDMELLKNQILDWIDQGLIQDARYLIEQLFNLQPLDFHLLYLRLYIAAIEKNRQVLDETWLLLNAYYHQETDVLNELDKIVRSSVCSH